MLLVEFSRIEPYELLVKLGIKKAPVNVFEVSKYAMDARLRRIGVI